MGAADHHLDDELNAAQADLDRATARAHTAQALRDLADRQALAYAPIDDDGTYLVTWNGAGIGHLHHDPADSWLQGWTAHTGAGDPLGPYLTPRQAATALLKAGQADAPKP
jgi:hypothetical protein